MSFRFRDYVFVNRILTDETDASGGVFQVLTGISRLDEGMMDVRQEIVSEITGTVWSVEVETGASVTEDDVLLILEAMKMEIPVNAPYKGRVVEVLVADGDVVMEGQPLVVVERMN